MSSPLGFNTAGAFMMGAKDRLLPPSLTYRFFATAVVLHLAAWVVLALNAGELAGFRGGPGPVLAALHLVTLGTLAMTAMGAAYQILPVATHRPLGPRWACALSWWLFTPGVILLAVGFGTGLAWAQHAGGCLAVAALSIFAVLVGKTLRQVKGLPGLTRHVWLALGSLAALAVLGLALVFDWTKGFLPDHQAVAAAHALLAGYGFMGMLALGFSTVLIPMFVLSPPPPEAVGRKSPLVAAAALAVSVAGALFWPPLVAAGAVIGAVALWLHEGAQHKCLKARMKKKLEPFFRLAIVGGAMMPVSMILGVAVALGAGFLAPAWAFVMVFGWLLSFALAILQRIMPFLASMHTSLSGGKVALVSRLAAQKPLTVHLVLHASAVALVALGLGFGVEILVRAGTLSGLGAAVAYLAFSLELARRWRRHVIDNRGN